VYLVFLVRVEQKDIDGLQLLDVTVSFELLSHLCADGRDGHVERVHLLDFGSLRSIRGVSWSGGFGGGHHTARTQSR
jgi:hypothetical protein